MAQGPSRLHRRRAGRGPGSRRPLSRGGGDDRLGIGSGRRRADRRDPCYSAKHTPSPRRAGTAYLRDSARTMNAEAAATRGDLAETISIATAILRTASSSWWKDAVRVLGFSALLAKDQQSLQLAVDVADRALRMSPGLTVWGYNARHRLQLLQGHPSVVDPHWRDPTMRADPPSSGTLWLLGREALDAGAADVALVPRPGLGATRPPRPGGTRSDRGRHNQRREPLARGPHHRPQPKASGSSPSTRSKESLSLPPRSGAGRSRYCSSARRSVFVMRPATNGASPANSTP